MMQSLPTEKAVVTSLLHVYKIFSDNSPQLCMLMYLYLSCTEP